MSNRVYRLLALGVGTVLLLFGSYPAAAFFLMLGLTRFPWAGSLATSERFIASVCSLAVMLVLLIGGHSVPGLSGGVAAAQSVARLVRTVVIVYAFFATSSVFRAFTRDPTLGVRGVSQRLALSHVLVVSVPLAIVVLLWVSSTYLGVNADRALMAARGVDREALGLEQSLRLALRTGGDAAVAARAVAAERHGSGRARARSWCATRWSSARRARCCRTARRKRRSPAGARTSARWRARYVGQSRPDTLPAHGVVQLSGRRWLGAAARDPARTCGWWHWCRSRSRSTARCRRSWAAAC